MEQCPVCGAATRPGAKFCTSCGSRLDDVTTPDATQETQVAAPAVPVDDAPSTTESPVEDTASDTEADQPATDATQETTWGAPASSPDDDARDEEEVPSWSSSWSGSAADPASRFEAALDREEREKQDDAEATTWTWGGASSSAETTDEPEDVSDELPATDAASSGWSTPISSMSDDEDEIEEATAVAATPDGDTDTADDAPVFATDTAGFSSAGEVDFLSGDESLDESAIAAAPSGDARKRASALLDEARRLIWTISDDASAAAPDSRAIINNMKRLRGETADFADLRAVIDAARENPRDIDALRDLADQADRLGTLLDSHDRLRASLEDAISGEDES